MLFLSNSKEKLNIQQKLVYKVYYFQIIFKKDQQVILVWKREYNYMKREKSKQTI